MTKRTLITYISITATLLIGLATAITLNSNASQPAPRKASTLPTPPPTCDYCTTDLLTMSPEEIGQYSVDLEMNSNGVVSGTPKVLLSRIATREEITDLGLGCLGDFSSIEEPPLAVVILQGDLRYNIPGEWPSFEVPHYVALVLDMWAGQPTSVSFSITGSGFGKALNDPTLTTSQIYPCPEPQPTTRHYGETLEGIKGQPPPFYTYTAAQIATLTAGPTNPVPSTPIGGLPTIPRPEPTSPPYAYRGRIQPPPPQETIIYPTLPPSP